jgi:hypothetical protein
MKKTIFLALLAISIASCSTEKDPVSPYPFDTTFKVGTFSGPVYVIDFEYMVGKEFVYLTMIEIDEGRIFKAAFLVTPTRQPEGKRMGISANETLYLR